MKKKGNYLNIGIDDLVTYSISQLLDNKEDSTVERIVKKCFTLYPKKFSMSRYPNWPDSKKVHSALMRCRDKGWITGNAKSGFRLTDFGKRIVKKVSIKLKPQLEFDLVGFSKRKRNEKVGEKWELIKNYLRNSDLFKKYEKDKLLFSPNEKDVRKLLMCTLETPIRVVRQNLINCIKIAKEFRDKELFNFLIFCSDMLNIKIDKQIKKFG